MRLASISFQNYRSFAETQSLHLRPLTLLFGYNSAGKSAIVRLFPLLRDSIQTLGASPLDLASKAARGAAFSDIRSKLTSSPAFSFGINFVGGTSIGVQLRDLPEQRRHIVESLSFKDVSGGHQAELLWSPTEEASAGPEPYLFRDGVSDERLVPVTFRGLTPKVHGTDGGFTDVVKLVLQEFASSVFWLQATRALPPRREAFLGTPARISEDGSGVTQYLYGREAAGDDVLGPISTWYRAATNSRLALKRGTFHGVEMFSFALESIAEAPQPIDLADTGEGMGQVLPVISLLTSAGSGALGQDPLLLIEHPELHLHRAAEPALAELLCKSAGVRGSQIVVETHSESLLLAVQLALIEGRLKSEDVGIYWVRQSDSGAAFLSLVEFDELGRPIGDDWPPNVFAQNVEQSRKVVRARQARVANAS